MRQQSLILTFGKTLLNFKIKFKEQNKLGTLTPFKTSDGSYSLHSSYFEEHFHSSIGALKESYEKYIYPYNFSQLKSKKIIYVLDVCFGLGYNTGALLESLSGLQKTLHWFGLEIDKRPLSIALNNSDFNSIWSQDIVNFLKEINNAGYSKSEFCNAQMLWGDARKELKKIPQGIQFDLIMLDAFSPPHCPELWSEEFLSALAKKIAPKGLLTTYSRAAAIRGSLRRAGLLLYSLKDATSNYKSWSKGTIAIPTNQNPSKTLSQSFIGEPLSLMEEEHLLTKAAIPYRDPSGESTSNEILSRRKTEQQKCLLESTSAWNRRWSINS